MARQTVKDDKPRARPTPTGLLKLNCQCGQAIAMTLAHYELLRCKCGRVYWALEPKRDKGLQLFPWPGNPATLAPAPSNS